ncbi:MAG: response regulator [Acidobacteria bacterium]|nr:MAG: response regulator [Acidobacteriota bacterium]
MENRKSTRPIERQCEVKQQRAPSHPDERGTHDAFISLISDELRASLVSIKGSLGLVLGGACGEINQRMRDALATAYAHSERVIRFIGDLLELSEIEAGRIEMKREPVDLRQLIEQSVAKLSDFAAQRGVLMVTSPTDALPPVEGDREYLQRVMMTFLSHALTESSSEEPVIIATEHRRGWVTVSVKDGGPGMVHQESSHLFDTVYHLSAASRRSTGAKGLGLPICKAIIEQHAGEIGVENTPDGRRRFYFTLPAIDAHTSVGVPSPPSESWAVATATRGAVWTAPTIAERPPTPFILMVDDDSGLRRVVTRIVQHLGYTVETASNGEEAIEKVNLLHPDLLILDILMPVLSGFGVVQALKRQPATRDIPLLVLSTKEPSEAEKKALRLGPTKFLTKSLVTVESLTAAVNELLEQRCSGCEVVA